MAKPNDKEKAKKALTQMLLSAIQVNDLCSAGRCLNALEQLAQISVVCNPSDLSAVEMDYCKSGQGITAIGEYQARTGKGLKESKDAIDTFRAANGLNTFSCNDPSRS